MDSSRSAQIAVIQFLSTEGEHASQIYCRMKEVNGEQCLVQCTVYRLCQRYEARRVNIKDLPRSAQPHVVTNCATISAVDELIRQKRRITTREIAVELSINKGKVHRIIHKKLGYGKVCAEWVPKHLSENQKTARMGVCLTQQFLHRSHPFPSKRCGISASMSMAIIYSCTVPHEL
ncbi:hypothetical protein AVEN_154492-1 [Araneus ventricosus]|uniref:Mos1 transposase HTH domain-containing protein n=1 Tax=Araneus ventricosus TaxID=182803 RepID=A0A4Y2DL16_ARAVE|nr:hypothetical protein AVEN_238115-1 [Araneus ventricosus]GBM16528.1 hypothetical protein AVEN_125149-1 [Araneus ventricosus]GBM16542.1 hypothetical protein AVEN_134011-1 [Araneus ventricosus]GBM16552.1 hypothetical protein AVEN_154492-1 [Araneus ventricosus]